MRSAIILLSLGALLSSGVAACASPRYATSHAEADRRGSRSKRARAAELRREAEAEIAPLRPRRGETRTQRRAREREEARQQALDAAYADRVLKTSRGRRTRASAAARPSAPPVRATPRDAGIADPTALLAARPAAPSARPSEIIVEDGQSVFDVAQQYRTSVRAIAELNTLTPPYDLPSGLRLKIPPATASAPPVRYATPSLPPVLTPAPDSLPRGVTAADLIDSTAVVARRSRTEADALAAVAVASTRAPPPMPSAPAAVDKGRFAWPLKGALLSGFGPKGPGLRNDGIDLAARPGEPVKASAAGEVVYAGKEIAAFGNLVLLKHAGGWVTAYAHLGRISVAMRQTVTQGQSIGEAGDTGAADAPRLHFEVRAPSAAGPAKPVDPATVLPPA